MLRGWRPMRRRPGARERARRGHGVRLPGRRPLSRPGTAAHGRRGARASWSSDGLDAISETFDAEHTRLFTFALPLEHEFVTLRAAVRGKGIRSSGPPIARGGSDATAAVIGTQAVYMDGRDRDATVYDRAQLEAGNRIAGPAIVMEMDSTTVILPGHHGRVDAHGNILIYPDGHPAATTVERGRRSSRPARRASALLPQTRTSGAALTFDDFTDTRHSIPETAMPAKIIQRNRKPMKKVNVDTVTIDIIESALRNARFEMDTVLFRTAMSPGIREQHDEFPMIANLEGKMVVGQFGSFI